MITYMALILVVSFVIAALWKYFDSRNWIETSGEVTYIEVEEIYNRPISSMSAGKKFTEYKINLKYEFTHNGNKYSGTQLYPLIPNVFSHKAHADEIIETYTINESTPIFFNPNNPNESCLITSKNFSAVKVFSISLILLICVVFTISGVVYFLQRFEN